MISYASFCRTHAGRTLDGFLASVRAPFIYIESLKQKSDAGFQTVANANFRDALQADDDAMLLAVEKRAGGNAFGMMITLGRAPNNDLVIPDQRISKFHAYFRCTGDEWAVVDANSRNGTSVNGLKVAPQTPTPIASGAAITLSDDLELVFLLPQDLHRMIGRG